MISVDSFRFSLLLNSFTSNPRPSGPWSKRAVLEEGRLRGRDAVRGTSAVPLPDPSLLTWKGPPPG